MSSNATLHVLEMKPLTFHQLSLASCPLATASGFSTPALLAPPNWQSRLWTQRCLPTADVRRQDPLGENTSEVSLSAPDLSCGHNQDFSLKSVKTSAVKFLSKRHFFGVGGGCLATLASAAFLGWRCTEWL